MGRQPKKNVLLEDHKTWILLDISTNKYPSATMKIDKADAKLSPGRVCIDKYGYPVTWKDGRSVRVHRLIHPFWEETDHINGDKTDNRKINLREATNSQNKMNIGLRASNTSGTTGVSWDRANKRWQACIGFNHKWIHLGTFRTKLEAIECRERAVEEFHGAFSHPTNGKE